MDGKGLFVLHCLSAGCITGWSTKQSQEQAGVAGVSDETETLTSKLVLEVDTLTHCMICRVTECMTESPTGRDTEDC